MSGNYVNAFHVIMINGEPPTLTMAPSYYPIGAAYHRVRWQLAIGTAVGANGTNESLPRSAVNGELARVTER